MQNILECWKETGCWWKGEKEKYFYRLLAGNNGLYEIYREENNQKWFLYRIYD
ncbi:hypothetical protein TherJR_1037 [Calderihabitans maritimus]|uniref:DUF6504 domain-containing protein n=1 Tax=Calderihabitans maritimus TaxID=1246530 RepID=A0A1Z5HWH0_9FIRM|nr:hypothetical protein TherJR_1037 [Calderihabitans maritimus]